MSDHWIDRLSAYVDDELTPAERAACEAHLETCAECRAVAAELESLVRAAARFPVHPPPDNLWDGIATRVTGLPQEGVVAPAEETRDGRRISFSLPQLALAASLLAAVSAGVSWVAANRNRVEPSAPREAAVRAVSESFAPAADARPVGFADAQYDAAVSDLERVLLERRDSLDPRTVRVLERNLAVIDEAIRQARAALDADPANPFLNSHLVDARQRKLDLLRRAALLADGGD